MAEIATNGMIFYSGNGYSARKEKPMYKRKVHSGSGRYRSYLVLSPWQAMRHCSNTRIGEEGRFQYFLASAIFCRVR